MPRSGWATGGRAREGKGGHSEDRGASVDEGYVKKNGGQRWRDGDDEEGQVLPWMVDRMLPCSALDHQSHPLTRRGVVTPHPTLSPAEVS